MSDNDKTDPNWQTKLAEANKRADPWADKALGAVQGSEYTVVIIVAVVVALIGFGIWISH